MPLVSSPLLREWGLLQEQIVPRLLEAEQERRPPTVWALGSVADAVAVAVAYQHARPSSSPGLRAFVSGTEPDLGAVSFSLSDIRCMPARTRSASFRRMERGWVPEAGIAEQVILAAPSAPVDLVTVGRSGPLGDPEGGRLTDWVVQNVRGGGHVLYVDPAAPEEPRRGLRSVGGSGRLYRKYPRSRTGGSAGGEDGAEETLAERQAQSDLVATHARLARSLARRFSHHGESKEDLEQVALLALVKAARRFDPARETSFSTYATASILGEIKRHFRDKTWMMRVPRSVQEMYLATKEARESLTHELSRSPTVAQVAERLEIGEETVLEAMEAGENYWPESLDVAVFEGESGREVPVTDGGFELTLERQQFVSLLPRLAPRERLILKRLFFDGWTQRQVAEEVGVSQMQISRLLARTIEKLRRWIAE